MSKGATAEVADARMMLHDSARCGPEVEAGCVAFRVDSPIRDALTKAGLVMDCTYVRYAQHTPQPKSRSVWGVPS